MNYNDSSVRYLSEYPDFYKNILIVLEKTFDDVSLLKEDLKPTLFKNVINLFAELLKLRKYSNTKNFLKSEIEICKWNCKIDALKIAVIRFCNNPTGTTKYKSTRVRLKTLPKYIDQMKDYLYSHGNNIPIDDSDDDEESD